MPWLPDHIWLAQKMAAKGGGGGKGWGGGQGWGGQATKKDSLTKQSPKAKAKAKAKAKSGGNPMQMMMQMMNNPAQKGMLKQLMGGTSSGKAAAPGSGIGQAKMFLAQWLQSQTGEQASKDKIVYTTTQIEDSKPPEFVSEVVLVSLDSSKSYKGKKSPNKKAAEAAAAEAALRQNGQGALLKSGSQPAAKKAAAKPKDPKLMETLKGIDASCKVWVGGLAEKTTEKALTKLFTDSIGKPKIAAIMRKGRAVVCYDSADMVTTAIATLNGSELDGKALEVDVWTQVEKEAK